MKLQIWTIVFVFVTCHALGDRYISESEPRDRSVRVVDKTIFLSLLGGRFIAVQPSTGNVKWTLNENPVLRVPVTVQNGFTFLPDPQDGSMYVLTDGRLSKLPFTIPQLVQASPCKSDEGILYAGNKRDIWMAINPETGDKVETLSGDAPDKVCPASSHRAVFIGRTEYQLSMYDTRQRSRKWNATFTDYSSHVLPEDASYKMKHYTSSADGRLVTVDPDSGRILWERNFGDPIVAMYIIEGDGLHRLPFTVIGKETLELLTHNNRDNESHMWWANPVHENRATLYPSLYVGETQHGLYALPALVDEQTATIAPRYLGPPLLEGPKPIADPSPLPPSHRPRILVHPHIMTLTHKTVDGNFLVLGYHEPPKDVHSMRLDLMRPQHTQTRTLPAIGFDSGTPPPYWSPQLAPLPNPPPPDLPSTQAMMNLLTLFISLVALLVAVIILFDKFKYPNGQEPRSTQVSWPRQWQHPNGFVPPDNGWFAVGKIYFDPKAILGRGACGTVVYKGKFDGREVAVKRVVSEFWELAEREVQLLRESDTHHAVIRYYSMESDSQFRYIAVELCWATLNDYVTQVEIQEQCSLTPLQILNQATMGLDHLHSLNIVHRDVKPQNVLLARNEQTNHTRTVISDFGLCKKLAVGRNSISRRSGLTGTEGWTSPEALSSNTSVTCAVDVFSLGCVYFYVLTDGHHPFGDNLRRQANILTAHANLDALITVEDGEIYRDIVTKMISSDPSVRPSIKVVLHHPVFWKQDKILAFFQDVSDRVEKEEKDSEVLRSLEKGGRFAVKLDWKQHICEPLQTDLRKFRSYRGNSVRDLLRALRNKRHHYMELEDDVKLSLGSIPIQFTRYFTVRFPKLLIHTYNTMQIVCNETIFQHYYGIEITKVPD